MTEHVFWLTQKSEDKTEEDGPEDEPSVPYMVVPHQGQAQEHEYDAVTCRAGGGRNI